MSQATTKMEASQRRRGGDGRRAPPAADLRSAPPHNTCQHVAVDTTAKQAKRPTSASSLADHHTSKGWDWVEGLRSQRTSFFG